MDELPEPLVKLVEALLAESECKQLWEKEEKKIEENVPRDLHINLHSLQGMVEHSLVHALRLSHAACYLVVFDISKDLNDVLVSEKDSQVGLQENSAA